MRYSCDYCVKMKRKCDKKSPCSLCSSKNIPCSYSELEQLESTLNTVEARIQELELNLVVSYEHKDKKKESAEPLRIVFPFDTATQLLSLNLNYIYELGFKKFSFPLSLIEDTFFRATADIFWPLKLAICAAGATFLKPMVVPDQLADRIELAKLYLHQAQTFDFLSNCDHISVLTLYCISSVLFSKTVLTIDLDEKEAMLVHIKHAIGIAKAIGINTELGIARLSYFDYERENIRRIWWLLFANFASIANSIGINKIFDTDHQVFLPSDNFYFETASTKDYYGIEIMSSKEWFTPSMSCDSLQAYRILLNRIQLKIQLYAKLEFRNDPISNYVAGTIDASLHEWNSIYTPIIKLHLFYIKHRIATDYGKAWLAVYITLLYNGNRVNLVLPKFVKNVIKGKKLTGQLYFKDALETAIHNSYLLNLIIKANPSFEYLGTNTLISLFPCAFFLLCCRKFIPDYRIENAYNLHLHGIKMFGLAFQKYNRLHNILIYMEKMTLLNSIIFYGIFKRRNLDETVEKQTPTFFENFQDY
ncbi:hypothetical protein HDV06_006785 [Boothiomyces sp. JEL0866]|nr:hypothetical protein HDV06_006785 [Boothiomyces sp. JEL0866]